MSGLVAGIQLHRGSRDDLALCPSTSDAVGRSGPNAQSRVRRHASVVLLRRSLAEAGRVGPVNSSLSQPSLAVWNSTKSGSFSMLPTVLLRLTCIYISTFIEFLHCTQKRRGVIRKYQHLTCINQDIELT